MSAVLAVVLMIVPPAFAENAPITPASAPITLPVGQDLGDVAYPCQQSASGRCKIGDFMDYARVCALLVIKSGEIRLERYNPDPARCRDEEKAADGPAKLYGLASVTKSLTSILLGHAIAKRRHADTRAEFEAVVAQPVDALIPELAKGRSAGGYAGVPLESLLDMRSGVRWNEYDHWWGVGDATKFKTEVRDDPREKTIVQFAQEYRKAWSSEVGRTFNYSGLDAAVVAIVAERLLEGPKLTEFLKTGLWEDIGAEGNAKWGIDNQRSPIGYCCFRMTARDLAKFGLLVLNKGRTAKGQILPEAWFDLVLHPRAGRPIDIPSGNDSHNKGCRLNYSSFWWLFPSQTDFTGVGRNGQFLHIFPSDDTVIVQISDWGDWDNGDFLECESFRAHQALVEAL